MSNFKIGDKVRVILDTGEIISFPRDYQALVHFGGDSIEVCDFDEIEIDPSIEKDAKIAQLRASIDNCKSRLEKINKIFDEVLGGLPVGSFFLCDEVSRQMQVKYFADELLESGEAKSRAEAVEIADKLIREFERWI